MSGNQTTKSSTPVLSRRNLLHSVSVTACTMVAGCASSEDGIEILVDNASGQPVDVAVLLTDDEEEQLFSHVFSLELDQFGRAGDVNQKPLEIFVFTSNGNSKSWEYTPSHSRDSGCNMGNIGMTLTQEGAVDKWYDC
ncbi:hypothetical protein [Natronorubrum sp. DTA7]|uniref:hypothetical protein n=1 Tax=Natronorubrum sp. DTA7 TaxID=3447016 RepID=UPI003F87B81F